MEQDPGATPYDGRHFGRDRCVGGNLPRHCHAFGYICVVIGGRFVEAGDRGRFRVEAGDVLVHRPYEAHADAVQPAGADVLNLPLPADIPRAGRIRVGDLDAVVKAAERDPRDAAALVADQFTVEPGDSDWPDQLAAQLRSPKPMAIGDWARRRRLAPETVSRGFRQAYGVAPSRFRADCRAAMAWQLIAGSSEPLVDIACALGFADQAHMTRAVRARTGCAPAAWRRQIKSVQDAAAAAR